MSDTPSTTPLEVPLPSESSAGNPPLIFAIKALLYPVTTVVTLLICLLLWGRPLVGPYFLIAVMSFAGVAELIDFSKLAIDHHRTLAISSLRYLIGRWCALIIGICALMYLSRSGFHVTDPPFVAWLILAPFMLWAVHAGVWRTLVEVGLKHMKARSAVIVGASEQGILLSKMLGSRRALMIDCIGYFDDAESDRTHRHPLPRLGANNDIPGFVRKHNIQLVYITLPLSRDPALLRLLEALQDSIASIYFVPDLYAFDLIGAHIEVVHGIPLIAICESPFYGVGGLVKRFSDVLLASLILIAIAPLFLFVAAGVKLSSPGPVIFKQRRYGLDGREIMVRKFRSMTVTEDGDNHYKQVTRNDSRVTPFGAFIRRTSLDELPQFLNVLEGSMSVVGPRPHAVAVNERYREQIPSYMIRHKVKPGITGWAQVNGYRGGDDLVTMTKRIEFDLVYLSNWSLWFDLKIIALTLSVVVKDHHAY